MPIKDGFRSPSGKLLVANARVNNLQNLSEGSSSQRTTVRSIVTPAGEERQAVMFWFKIEPKRSASAAIGSPEP